jgi:hypothetical protein
MYGSFSKAPLIKFIIYNLAYRSNTLNILYNTVIILSSVILILGAFTKPYRTTFAQIYASDSHISCSNRIKLGTGYFHIMSPISCKFRQNQRRQIRTLFNVVNEVPPPPIFYIYYPIWAQFLTQVLYVMLSSVCELRKNRRKNSVPFFFLSFFLVWAYSVTFPRVL